MGTNFVDTTADLTGADAHRVRPVGGGAGQEPSTAFTLAAGHVTEPVVRVPIRAGGAIKYVWTGDLDGDGEWSFGGVYNAASDTLTAADRTKSPWPAFTLFWDGDLSAELLNDGKIEQWDPAAPADSKHQPRVLTVYKFGALNAGLNNPALIGDLFGDWREEAVAPRPGRRSATPACGSRD